MGKLPSLDTVALALCLGRAGDIYPFLSTPQEAWRGWDDGIYLGSMAWRWAMLNVSGVCGILGENPGGCLDMK